MTKQELVFVATLAIKDFNLKGSIHVSDSLRDETSLIFCEGETPHRYSWEKAKNVKAQYKEPWQRRKWGDVSENIASKPWCFIKPKAYENILFTYDRMSREEQISEAISIAKEILLSEREINVKNFVQYLCGDMWGKRLWNSKEELEFHNKEAEDLYNKVFDFLCLPVKRPEWSSPFWGWEKPDTKVDLINPDNVDEYYKLD